MDEWAYIDHPANRAERCGTVTSVRRREKRRGGTIVAVAPAGSGLPQLVATRASTIGRSPEQARVLVSAAAN